MNTEILKDSSFEKEYEEKIIPFCKKYENSNFFDSFDGKKIHYLSYINEKAKAAVVILHGFTECAKKFDEMAYYFFSEGYSVFVPDLRGHGLSYKDDAPAYAVSSMGFDDYSQDMNCFINGVVCKYGLSIYCYTHSLGGNVALLSLIDFPALPIEKLVLSSPMICGNMGMPVAVAKVVAGIVCAIGKGNMAAPGKCVFEPEKCNEDAACVERGKHSIELKSGNENYQTCGPTMRWVLHSIEARDKILREENIKKINAKMLVIKPEKDRQLLEKYQNDFIGLCRKCERSIEVIETRNTCHEIFQSRENELKDHVSRVTEFFS